MLNRLDAELQAILAVSENVLYLSDKAYIRNDMQVTHGEDQVALLVIMRFTNTMLQQAVNKDVYNSVEVSSANIC